MHDEMDRLAARTFGEDESSQSQGMWSPAVEILDRDNEMIICADLPGLKPEDVKVEVTDDALIIQGERKWEREDNREGRMRSERRYGQFCRVISLPEGVNPDQIRANFEQGELKVTVPVTTTESKRRQIPISASDSGREGSRPPGTTSPGSLP